MIKDAQIFSPTKIYDSEFLRVQYDYHFYADAFFHFKPNNPYRFSLVSGKLSHAFFSIPSPLPFSFLGTSGSNLLLEPDSESSLSGKWILRVPLEQFPKELQDLFQQFQEGKESRSRRIAEHPVIYSPRLPSKPYDYYD